MAATFASSGPDLFDNVIASQSPALLESRGVVDDSEESRKAHDKDVTVSVVKASVSTPLVTAAFLRGFNHDDTIDQLKRLGSDAEQLAPTRISVGRMTDSRITPQDVLDELPDSIEVFTYDGDHSLADNVRYSAAFMLRSVGAVSS